MYRFPVNLYSVKTPLLRQFAIRFMLARPLYGELKPIYGEFGRSIEISNSGAMRPNGTFDRVSAPIWRIEADLRRIQSGRHFLSHRREAGNYSIYRARNEASTPLIKGSPLNVSKGAFILYRVPRPAPSA